MKLKHLSLSLAVAFATPSFAKMSDAQLAQAMRADIAKYMVTLKTPRLIFHWADASDITPQGQYNQSLPGNHPNFKAYVDRQGSKIFRARSTNDADIEGPGLYLASEPTSTRHYGGEKSFGLIIGLVKPGAKILNGDASAVIAPNIDAEINARGCTSAYGSYTSLLDSAGDAKCTKVKQLLVGADISFADGRLYQYGSNLIHGCSKRSPYKDINVSASRQRDFDGLDTFVGFNSRLFSEVMGITNKTKIGSHALSNQVLSYLKGLQVNQLAGNASYSLVSDEQLKDSKIPAMSKADIARFSQKYIMGCNL